MMTSSVQGLRPREVNIRVHDRVEIAVALYMPASDGPFPVLFAPSPYRYDNNLLPASPQFLWRETGPIEFYVGQGYVYANMDVRGCGKSGGEFRLLDRNEQKDLYEVIEWLGHQPWSNGKVGGIGQSYFCMLQWWMAIQKPPSLACIAAFDGMNDPYRASVYQGGILGDFFGSYWWNQNRIINRHPANGQQPREQPCDINLLIQQHPTYDDFWRERCAAERLHESNLGTVGLNFQVAGFGDFNADGTTDMMLRNVNTGQFELYDIVNNRITSASNVGTVGLAFQVAGFADFNQDGTTDMLLRNVNTGQFELYDIRNNAITSASSLGAVGPDFQVAGFGPFHAPGASDMILRNGNTGQFEVYDIVNNQITTANSLGAVGLDFQVGGFAADPATGSMGSSDSTSQLVQAMAGFGGGSGAADGLNTGLASADTSQHPLLTAPQHACG